jgi:Nucleoside 2-deoxyribosyltransferase like
MQLLFSDQAPQFTAPSIFLAGPTPRDPAVPSWRPDAIAILYDLGFTGTVLIPERRDWQVSFDYLDQVEWEYIGLEQASVISFWVPRDVLRLPGFTTNVEFGRYVDTPRCVYGRPDSADKNRYLDWLYRKLRGQAPCTTLEQTLTVAVALGTSK